MLFDNFPITPYLSSGPSPHCGGILDFGHTYNIWRGTGGVKSHLRADPVSQLGPAYINSRRPRLNWFSHKIALPSFRNRTKSQPRTGPFLHRPVSWPVHPLPLNVQFLNRHQIFAKTLPWTFLPMWQRFTYLSAFHCKVNALVFILVVFRLLHSSHNLLISD